MSDEKKLENKTVEQPDEQKQEPTAEDLKSEFTKVLDERDKKAEGTMTEMLKRLEEQGKTLAKIGDELVVMKKRGGATLPGFEEKEKKQFSLMRAIRGVGTKNWTGCEYEKEVMEAAASKALTTSTAYVIPEEYFGNEFIEVARANIVAQKLGARIMYPTHTPALIPKSTAAATAYWTAENGEVTASDPTHNELSLSPKICSGLTVLSKAAAITSDPAIEEIIKRDLMQVVAVAIDAAALVGTGSSNQPTGIVSTASINTVDIATNGGQLTINHCKNMIYELDVDNCLAGKLGWAMHPRTWYDLVRLMNAEDAYYLGMNVTQGQSRMLLGYPIETTTNIPINLTKGTGTDLSEIIFGNWDDLIIAYWGGIGLEASDVANDYWVKNQLGVKAVAHVDIGVRKPASFCVCDDIETAS